VLTAARSGAPSSNWLEAQDKLDRVSLRVFGRTQLPDHRFDVVVTRPSHPPHVSGLTLAMDSSTRARLRGSSSRRFARYRTEFPVVVRVLGHDGEIRIHGRCFELAEAGMGAVITSHLGPGEMVNLEFFLPQPDDQEAEFNLRAVVRHRMGFLHGFEFVVLLPAQRQQIQTLCHTLKPA